MESAAPAPNPLLAPPPELTATEQELLDEYARLSANMKTLAAMFDNMAGAPTTTTLDGLRELERKTSLVLTLLKASVYSIVLQQEIDDDWGGADDGHHPEGLRDGGAGGSDGNGG